MHQIKTQPTSLALFCKVVDNFGDIGICWRLARQLEREHDIAVTLWVDDLRSFQQICPEVSVERETQQIANVTVRHWRDQSAPFTSEDVADIVIEFFACDIPPTYIVAMAQRSPKPVWLNLEGLSAETWVEGCHKLSSLPSQSLTKYFFFPGFTDKTGGLLRESELQQQRHAFQHDPAAMSAFLARFGVTPAEMASLKVSLFCYPNAPVSALFDSWKNGNTAVTCLIPEGVAVDAVQAFLGRDAIAGATTTRAGLTVQVLPFMPQPDYDKLLWACDLNFVRGEDSFVRAQWAGKPFIWQIYPQDKDLHHVKLKAFLQCHTAETEISTAFCLGWNGATNDNRNWTSHLPESWLLFAADLEKIAMLSMDWESQMMKNGDFTSNLLKFAETVR
ncbi:elongation factor P maturation arginine rhamnosyltransferase EarP [Glaciimonas sp. Gout2]|uniref:elongation factor P maturation arginine rhamnosyltransferase EarP n=1 Tax=unclassified Glaciimonas TaxID=2644401 RepID=UPI002B22C43E|nr:MULTISPECIES: elongation factor P maturation arginine rhamnosyltransferase EarP [unclassified Glaciimonas]MEB0014319.1 elongation factor P maturation arginine rhamnosyltransferase EarP [Glaciimonas sp. Cout2]MEB0084110.1 elongation factor P maturation arginine rhamnosyltransferase EarP [Glaciimonas sp. Gout2]